ncbi:NHL repeat-containing protein [Alkaliphilus peptidifermentans]|uniref:NHL repeat-containing protein n=1 Tax=Alkaliphilus peptidifermentans DSM 18978 TaxID=1120976 RepID=A0A1G5K5R9_9FIRM|nr:hypothetical protein [Alkaliphilus peptidifermentans]SCY96003.1 hypothetical protein SAMN03080606_03245 [Alkaliphilus peptidifermentans DSM 18978]
MTNWEIDKVYNFRWKNPWKDGYAHFGFHDKKGCQYIINTEFNWVGAVGDDNMLEWSAGPQVVENSKHHITLDINVPNAGCVAKDDSVLIASEANNIIYKIEPDKGIGYEFVDAKKMGLGYIGSCEYDLDGNIWVIELTGSRIWKLDSEGNHILTLGTGSKGFQKGTVSFDEAEFSLMSCLKCGADGNLYIVDSGNYSVRMLNPYERTVTTLVGTGEAGYSGDGGDAAEAKLGKGDYIISFYEGPWYLSLDEECNIYIADTGNNVLRRVDRKTNIITTIAGKHKVDRTKRIDPNEKDPFKIDMPYLVSVEYFQGRLFVSDWRGDLVIMKRP